MSRTDAEPWLRGLDLSRVRAMSAQDLRSLRATLRRERQRVCAETISRGPTDELCHRMNDIVRVEQHVARASRSHPRRGSVRHMFAALRRVAGES